MEERPLRFLIVDDNAATATVARVLLERAGHEARVITSSVEALRVIPVEQPDGVLLDILMPELDGFELCRRLREMPELADLKILMFSGKAFEYDRRRSAELGADGYIQKPIQKQTFLAEIDKVIRDEIEVAFWGVRGTLPRPGRDSIRYGGNTNCTTVRFATGPFFILDAGTGIKQLGDHLSEQGGRVQGRILLSHPHWDHINALPFFKPLFVPGNEFEIIGASQGDTGVRDYVSAQMDGVYFPITIREFGASVSFRDLPEGSHRIGGIGVETMLLSHPGNCLGYRLNHGGRSLCYVTDNELFPPSSEHHSQEYLDRLTKFVSATDALITDATYLDDEYPSRVGWGHSPISQVVELAARARVETLYLFHHDPDQDDDAIDRKLDAARAGLARLGSPVRCEAPREGDTLRL